MRDPAGAGLAGREGCVGLVAPAGPELGAGVAAGVAVDALLASATAAPNAPAPLTGWSGPGAIGANGADRFVSATAGGTSTKLRVDGPELQISRVGTLALAGFVVSMVIP